MIFKEMPNWINDEINFILSIDDDYDLRDYSCYDYGIEMSAKYSIDDIRLLVNEFCQVLPANHVESILSGLLDTHAIDGLDIDLLTLIEKGRQVDTAGDLAHILVKYYGYTADQVAELALERLAQADDPSIQDRLAFVLHALFRTETLYVKENRMVSSPTPNLDMKKIGRILTNQYLTDYARKILLSFYNSSGS